MSDFNRKKGGQVTLPMSNMQDGETKFYRIDAPIIEGVPKPKTDGSPSEKTAAVAKATDLVTGIVCQLIMQTVMQSSFERFGEYVGHCFEISCKGKREGKRYKDFDIFEIDCPEQPPRDQAGES